MSILPVHIEDVTVRTDLKTDIPLEKMVSAEENADYDAEGSKGVVYKMEEPRSTALIFSDGKIVCTGAKSIREAEDAIKKVVGKIKDLGVEIKTEPGIEIEKIVAAFRLRDPLNLEETSGKLKGSRYEKEKVPAVLYRTSNPRADFLILENKMICTGCQSIKDVQGAVTSMKETLESAGIKVELV
ncbi:MAG: hypothetical protein JSV63_03765 [Candidatus Aenigmatarchaeota archaeon]|nr:MAG: hypothetical protein JSV63_03765 [Candidatus Aenigmarchaeota archaeon]